MTDKDNSEATQQGFYNDNARFYDLIYHSKDYPKEAAEVKKLIEQNKKSNGNDLLEVGCGTGKHLEHLVDAFECTGVDLNPGILDIARQRHHQVNFVEADMSEMDLGKQFDVITCLFSAIGYVKTYEKLEATLTSFAKHLKPGGVIIIEPWLTKENYHIGTPHMATYEDKNIKIARLNTAQVEGDVSILDFHFLVAEKDQPVRSFRDKHELGMFDHQRTLDMMETAGLTARFDPNGFMEDRGIFIATKPI